MTTNLLLVYKMEKRDRPPKGFYKSLEGPVDFLVDRSRCQKKPTILRVFQAERVVAKKIESGKPGLPHEWKHMGTQSSHANRDDRGLWKSRSWPSSCTRSPRKDWSRVWKGIESSSSVWSKMWGIKLQKIVWNLSYKLRKLYVNGKIV